MSAWEPEDDEEFLAASDEPEEESPSSDADDDFDDIPATSLSDAEYDRFVAGTFDAAGREKGDPPVAAMLIGITLLVLVVWLFFRR